MQHPSNLDQDTDTIRLHNNLLSMIIKLNENFEKWFNDLNEIMKKDAKK